ncbi:hypothetical protein GGS23DRAFT_592441 [Durotheca rogersii]|uniref:uncharacterized protein n=1 Tax=Durotheca rogersii TaxID=419775 RepID=UPI0022206576|nr:uncharacterized protein GGS23DRAFT_592441 [Durotheca rogersii]KAI5868685.1 hypothetical protein GGS23DRAFT_592441 [Durotheca rogersii]
MSTSEDQELMAKISQLAGRINRHKAQRDGLNSDLNKTNDIASRGSHRAAPYPRGGYRGGRGRALPTYRNRSLVLNSQPKSAADAKDGANEPSDPSTPASAWVTKTDRHMQLINSSVYEKETQQRASAIEQTFRHRQAQRNKRETAAFMNSILQNGPGGAGGGGFGSGPSHNPPASASRYEVVVDGIRFHVVRQGSKLVKAPDDVNPPAATPKVTSIGGVKFHRTKHGNLVRHGIVKAQRFAGGVKKVDEQCKTFSWTGIVFLTKKKPVTDKPISRPDEGLRSGSCPKGPRCRYLHDVSKTAICRDYLVKGACLRGEDCDLSHDVTKERTPLCLHFAKGNCHNPSCSYVHAEHSPTDPVCRSFGIYGYCERGAQCADRHVFECPDFSNTGVCKLKGCKRPHIERASVLRKTNNRPSSEEMEDLSSDDEDAAADSDDIDSDEVEEFIGRDGDDNDLDFAEQKDYIELR